MRKSRQCSPHGCCIADRHVRPSRQPEPADSSRHSGAHGAHKRIIGGAVHGGQAYITSKRRARRSSRGLCSINVDKLLMFICSMINTDPL
jgi:hypothetical protein